ncbi:MAG: hypothetical protein HY288_01165 [Planctomycetia bacterium]|nr:hypothetical protein [Planctomycetia bacterium]
MRQPGLLVLFVVWLSTIGPRALAAPDEPPQNKSMITSTRQNAFTIPFRIEPPQTPSETPLEVQLHVSANQGQTWELASRVNPEKAGFVFRAPHDGEYWYSIRTVDKQGIARPDGPLQPQLKVVVDTIAPRLDLSVTRGEAGEIVARWQAVDPNLKQGSFKLEYQSNSTGPWERVAVVPSPSAMRHTQTGEATWWPKDTSGSVLVRAEITDLAGNPAVSQATVKLGNAPSDGFPRGAGRDGLPAQRSGPQDSTRWPADQSTSSPLTRSGNPDNRGGAGDGGRSAGQRVPAQSIGQTFRGRGSGQNFGSLPLPAGERLRMVNSRAFELEYEVESVGPSGIGKVELWGTRDGGRTWSIFGIDTDNRSPLSVSVDGEGVYGFRIVVSSGSGFGGRPPAEGDMPEIWIGVDLTKPVGRITGAEVSPDGSELAIRWEASDEVPDPRPISLAFSAGAHGPWTPIASGLENTGSYHWRLDNRVPERIYLRVEIRDEAGNLGIYETNEPVSLDRHRPEGHIRGVRPVGQAERAANQIR